MTNSKTSSGTEPAPSAYAYPLLIKQLLHTPLTVAPEQEIVYRDLKRYNYWTLHHRIGQLASAKTVSRWPDNQARIQGVAILQAWNKGVRFVREMAAMRKHTEEVVEGLIVLLGAASVYMFVELCYILVQR